MPGGWKWWRNLEWHEQLIWVAAVVVLQEAPYLSLPLLQGVAIGLLGATLVVALRRRFGLLVLISAIGLWSAAGLVPREPGRWHVPLYVSLPIAFAVMLGIGAWYRGRNHRDLTGARTH